MTNNDEQPKTEVTTTQQTQQSNQTSEADQLLQSKNKAKSIKSTSLNFSIPAEKKNPTGDNSQ